MTRRAEILVGDALAVLKTLPADSVQACVTSPPYWGLRDYGVAEQIGLEATPGEFVARLVQVFGEVRRVLRPDGVLWLNLGDCYATGAGRVGDCPGGGEQGARWRGDVNRAGPANPAVGPTNQPNRMPIVGLKPKDLVGMPWRVAFALQADGWWLRSDCIWSKPNPMPESVEDRPTKAHDYVFLLTRAERYFYDAEGVAERATHAGEEVLLGAKSLSRGQAAGMGRERSGNGTVAARRNLRTVWTIPTSPFAGAHFATFPPGLAERCIRAGTSQAGACSECGAPLERVVDREFVPDSERPRSNGKGVDASNGWSDFPRGTTTTITTGWRRTCAHADAPTAPCLVLDPFAGAGTTGLVALRLGRRFVGVELNPAYAEMARQRIRGDAPLFNTVRQ